MIIVKALRGKQSNYITFKSFINEFIFIICLPRLDLIQLLPLRGLLPDILVSPPLAPAAWQEGLCPLVVDSCLQKLARKAGAPQSTRSCHPHRRGPPSPPLKTQVCHLFLAGAEMLGGPCPWRPWWSPWTPCHQSPGRIH